MTHTRKTTSDATSLLSQRFVRSQEDRDLLDRARADCDVAQLIHDARTKAGLSQRALAKLAGTTASVMCQLEDADYEGHSLAMLRRIAAVLGKRVEIRFVARGKSDRGPSSSRDSASE